MRQIDPDLVRTILEKPHLIRPGKRGWRGINISDAIAIVGGGNAVFASLVMGNDFSDHQLAIRGVKVKCVKVAVTIMHTESLQDSEDVVAGIGIGAVHQQHIIAIALPPDLAGYGRIDIYFTRNPADMGIDHHGLYAAEKDNIVLTRDEIFDQVSIRPLMRCACDGKSVR